MDIHPIFVHFPIAFLTIYALFECIPSKRLRQNQTFQMAKALLLVLGTGSAFITFQTGEAASELMGETALVEMHALWAAITLWVFGILSVVYIFALSKNIVLPKLESKFGLENSLTKIFQASSKITSFMLSSHLLIIFGLLGLIAISITGGLGGALVYGPDVDPVVHFVYSLFF